MAGAARGRGHARLFGDGKFATPTGRARFVAIKCGGAIAAATSEAWPFVLNTGRVRDQWHTMTRTGLSPRLATHVSEPFVEMHPDDAAALRSSRACWRASRPSTAPRSCA